ncbi:acyl--CoA ligase [Natronolimnobius sp. AArcel1]|uniref:AMP-binding protein n=1 Tax=Natronolimnobius sp. AArcel1 TaxID=1679093 RepID=UPI0013EDB0AA|nr:class I adenylate-forming enzyme family protein [Natronolimnobius sp. AArcel1]NGM70833.1 acyl--CoA ligase [Natronolimnobius sp. AArcel1]
MSKLIESLQSTVLAHQSETAIVGEESRTFSQLWSRTDAFAGGLRNRDLGAGERIGIRVADPRAFLVAFYGSLRNGCVPVTMPLEYDERAVATALEMADATAVVTDLERLPSILVGADSVRLGVRVGGGTGMGVSLESFLDNSGMNSTGTRSGIDMIRRGDEEVGLIAYLGEYDGEPLAITYSQSALAAAGRTGGGALELGQSDTATAVSPADGARAGQLGVLQLANPLELLFGATATLVQGDRYRPLETWDPETVRSLRYTTALKRVFLTPTHYDELRGLEGGTAAETRELPDETSAPFDEGDMAGVAILESAGESASIKDGVSLVGTPETGLTHVRLPADRAAGRLGEPLPGVQATVRQDGDAGDTARAVDADGDAASAGEVAVTGPTTMQGYLERPAMTEQMVTTTEETRWILMGMQATTTDGTIVLEGEISTPLPSMG